MIYLRVKNILSKYESTRNSDKLLIWYLANEEGKIEDDKLGFNNFMELPSFESITRARRKIQEMTPQLRANEFVTEERRKKERVQGRFIYN